MAEHAEPPPPTARTTPPPPRVLRHADCRTVLKQHRTGRLAFVVAEWPVVLPITYVVDGERIVFRTGAGSTLASLRRGARVCLEVDALDQVTRSGRSVVAFGHAREITDEADLARARSLPLQPWAGGPKDVWLQVDLVQLTGRELPKAWRYPDRVR